MDRKALSLPILISLVIGNMIGTGIYALPAALAKYGIAAIIAWVFTSAGAVMLALVYSNLNKRFPKTGGPYVYCKEAFGRMWGFVIGFIYWTSTMVSVGAIVVATTGYLGFIFPILDANAAEYSKTAVITAELVIIWVFAAINLRGIHSAGVVQFILTSIKIIPLVLISLFGLSKINLHYITTPSLSQVGGFSAISSAASLTFWAFVGLEAATIPAENTKGPRHIFIATVFGTLVTGILYFASTFVLFGLIPKSELITSQFPFATAGTLIFGNNAAFIVTLCAIASGLGALNSTILLQGQVVFAAARDHMFPKSFAKLSKQDVPVHAQLLSCGLISVLLLLTTQPTILKQFDFVAMLATLLTLFTYLATAIAELKFDLQFSSTFIKIMLKRTTLIGFLAALYTLWMISNVGSTVLITAAIITSLCIPIYYFTVRKYAHS